jgi:CrcB protein
MAVNVTGSLILGVMTGAGLAASSPFAALLGTGLCGAFTTYSAFSFETWRLIEEESYVSAIANVVISVGVGLGAVFLGYAAAVALAL